MTDGRIATISGTMLVPGVSRNRRLYTPELIARTAKRMQERIADPDGLPIVMRTHHDAGDDSGRIVGRLTGVTVEKDGSASYTADLYDTAPGRDIAALVTPKQPALRSVSIHGYWIGPLKRVTYEGEQVTTADDLEIDAVDFTATPGVIGASVTAASYLPVAPPTDESATPGGRTPISESVEATVQVVAEEAPPPAIRSKASLRRAVREACTPQDRAHAAQRAHALGLTALIPATWKDDGTMAETSTRYSDVREYYPDGPGAGAGFCIDAYNGPVSLTMRACGLDPAELRAITQAAMTAAVDALQAMDPDTDADIDVDGAPNADTDDDMASQAETAATAPDSAVTETTVQVDFGSRLMTDAEIIQGVQAQLADLPPAGMPAAATETSLPTPGEAAPTTQEEAAMGEPTTQETAADARSLTDADLAALGAIFGAALKESMQPVLTVIGENAKPTKVKTEASETASAEPTEAASKADKKAAKEAALREAIAAQVAAETARIREEVLREHGLPQRRGYRTEESAKPTEPTAEELFDQRAELLLGDFARTPRPAQ